MERWKELLERASAKAKEARAVAEVAEKAGRDMTVDERADFDAKFDEAVRIKADSDTAKRDADVMSQAKALADLVGMPDAAKADLDAQVNGGSNVKLRAKSLGLTVVESAQFKAMMASFGDRIPEKARVQSDPIQVKSLLTGTSDTSGGAFVVADQTGIVEMLGRRPLVLRDVISVRQTTSDAVEYVRQTSHTNAAAPVAEASSSAAPTVVNTEGTPNIATVTPNPNGGYKPEGSWAFERDTATVKTIAEWVPATKRALADVAALQGLINDELKADLAETEENEIVSGSGSGEHLAGIYNTSGIQVQAFDTDLFTGIRKAITKVKTVGRSVPNGIGMHPTDVETVDLAKDLEGRYRSGGPFAGGPRTLWGYPIVESEAFTAGLPVVGDYKKFVLWDREQATVTISDSHADFFIRNLVAILGEERVAGAVTRPTAFCTVDITP